MIDELEEYEPDKNDLVRCFNEARDVVIKEYLKIIKDFSNDYADGVEIDIDKFNVLETFKKDEEVIQENSQSFVVRASTLADIWLKDEKEKKRLEEEEAKKADQLK